MINRSKYIIVSSDRVKKEVQSFNRLTKGKIVVIPYGVPFDMVKDKSQLRQDFVGQAKVNQKLFLFVGMRHPIKNINFIVKTFRMFKSSKVGKDYKLIIANNVSRKKLKQLYQHATALLTASLYESYNLSVLEALSQGCPVIGLPSAVIPELTPYVNIANNQDQFVRLMVEASCSRIKSVSPKIILKKFSWKNYVNQLLQIFE